MNNGGWGLRVMLVFCAFFMFFIFMAAVNINKNFKDIAPKNYSTNQITYFDIEVKMVNATKKYITRTYNDIQENTQILVKLSTLVNAGYLVPVKDIHNNTECSGYILFIKKNKNIKYEPYLKCKYYKTNGYDNSLE